MRSEIFIVCLLIGTTAWAFDKPTTGFLEAHCFDCHGDGAAKGGLDLEKLGHDLSDPAVFAKWERLFDRVALGEMPPAKVTNRPEARELEAFRAALGPRLVQAHAAAKGTVLRRLNRREYENTMNDLFGILLELEDMLPEDGRSHEFDNVGDALGVSMQHMQMYLKAAGVVLEEAIAKTTEPPKPQKIVGRYTDCLLYTSPSPRDGLLSRMPSSA